MRAPTHVTRLGRLCAMLFVASTIFPLAASVLAVQPVPRWLGVADVAVAALLVVAAAGITTMTKARVSDADRVSAFRASQILSSVIPALLAIFFVVGDRVSWDVLVIGLGWRGWLLMYTLPGLIAAERTGPRPRPDLT
jgi:hypothetical protein